jgi:hypothetical protein
MVLPVRRYVTVEMAPVVTLRLELVFVFLGGLEKIAEHVCISFVSSSKKGLSGEGGWLCSRAPLQFFPLYPCSPQIFHHFPCSPILYVFLFPTKDR